MQSAELYGNPTYTCAELNGIPAGRRVKLKAGSTKDPVEIVFADAGEIGFGITVEHRLYGQKQAVRQFTSPGIFKIEAAAAITSLADVYGADDGKFSMVAVGVVIFQSLQAASGAGSVIEAQIYPTIPTTAGAVSHTDSGDFYTGSTSEAILQEVGQHLKSVQKVIPIPLNLFRLADGTALGKFADGASDTPGFSQENSKESVIRWNNHAAPLKISVSGLPMPTDLDPSANMTIHWRIKLSGSTDSPDFEHNVFFAENDTDCAGTDDEVDQADTLTEYSSTIANADIGGHPEEMCLICGPKATELGTDDLLLYSVWLEYKGKFLTS